MINRCKLFICTRFMWIWTEIASKKGSKSYILCGGTSFTQSQFHLGIYNTHFKHHPFTAHDVTCSHYQTVISCRWRIIFFCQCHNLFQHWACQISFVPNYHTLLQINAGGIDKPGCDIINTRNMKEWKRVLHAGSCAVDSCLMAHSHCTRPGQGPENDIFTLCTVHITQAQGIIVFYCAHHVPCSNPGPGLVQCV